MNKNPIILAIESSCDDTGVALIQNNKILSNIVANQKVHQNYGGVVPELASRAHQQNIIPVLNEALKDAKVSLKSINGVAYTRGPGLLGSLLVGSSLAKSLSLALNIPLIEVNHMHAHILAHFIDDASECKPEFPFLCLTVSGGHTQIVMVKDYFNMELIGETIDDAAGEAFDKIGKILGLKYPAGPQIDQLAKSGNPKKFTFSKPKVGGFNFSFSGLKTGVLYFLQKEIKVNPNFVQENLNDLCASVQYTIVEILVAQIKRVVKEYGISQIALAGGVSANSELRNQIKALENSNLKTFIPKFEYTTDNAAMIAMVGQLKYEKKLFGQLSDQSTSRYKI